MPLTPEDVRNRLFTTVRLREGYDQTEVDEFLDVVEVELQRLLTENEDLRHRLAEASEGRFVEPPVVEETAPPAPPAEVPLAEVPVAPPAEPARHEIVVRSSEEMSEAATKLLHLAQRTADELVADARAEAAGTIADANTRAEELTRDARTLADELDRETRERAAALEQEMEEERRTVLGKLEEERAALAREVDTLRAFEREYRSRLRAFLEAQLTQLTSGSVEDTPLAVGGPDGDGASGPDEDRDEDRSAVPAGVATAYGSAGSATGRSALGQILEEEELRGEHDPR